MKLENLIKFFFWLCVESLESILKVWDFFFKNPKSGRLGLCFSQKKPFYVLKSSYFSGWKCEIHSTLIFFKNTLIGNWSLCWSKFMLRKNTDMQSIHTFEFSLNNIKSLWIHVENTQCPFHNVTYLILLSFEHNSF